MSFTRFKLKIAHGIYSGTIPDDHVFDLFFFFFAFTDENKEVNVHFQFDNCLNITIMYIFQIKKSRLHSSQYFCKEYKISCTV